MPDPYGMLPLEYQIDDWEKMKQTAEEDLLYYPKGSPEYQDAEHEHREAVHQLELLRHNRRESLDQLEVLKKGLRDVR